MPGKHSQAKLQERQDRALQRGFLCAKPDRNVTYIEVPIRLVDAAKAAVKSLSLHCSHDEVTGEENHQARVASLHAAHKGFLLPADAAAAAATARL